MAVVVLLMPACNNGFNQSHFFFNFTWQLKMTGQEAVVSFSMVTIWSKLASTGAFSWLVGILADQSEVSIVFT